MNAEISKPFVYSEPAALRAAIRAGRFRAHKPGRMLATDLRNSQLAVF